MKRVLCLFVAAFSLIFSSMAKAEGFYLAPKFLMSLQNTGPVSRSGSLGGVGIDSYNQFTLGGGLAAGYDFWPQQMIPLRVEIEGALRGNSERKWSDYGIFAREVKGVWNNSTLFGNVFWDFHNDTSLTPYIGGGLGIAFNYTGYDLTLKNGDQISMDDRFANFAWNAGAGVSFNVNETLALDASYRFVGLGYNEVSATINGRKYEIGNEPYNNEFMLGMRFSF